jgi:O-antigen ligase
MLAQPGLQPTILTRQSIRHAYCRHAGRYDFFCLKDLPVQRTENRRLAIQRIMEWLFFLYPASLAVNRTAHYVVSALIFLTACLCLIIHARDLKPALARARRMWIAALCLPLLLAAIQCVSLVPPLALRDLDDVFRFFLCIPVYLALLIVRPNIRPFLWGCAFFAVYSPVLMFWHMHVLGLFRGIAPNGFLGLIPHTSLSIILGMLALRLWVAGDGSFRQRLLPALLMCSAFSVPLLTQTRSGLVLALALGILIWLLLPNKRIRILLYGGGGAIAVMAIVLSNSNLWTREDRTLTEIEHYMTGKRSVITSTTARIELWRLAGKMFAEHPLIGVGNHGYRAALSGYKAQGETPAQLELFTHPHNEFLKLAAEGGLLGVLSLALLYFVPLAGAMRRYLQRPSAANPALMVIIVSGGFLMAGMVDVMLAWRPTIMFYGVAVSLLLVEMDSSDGGQPT